MDEQGKNRRGRLFVLAGPSGAGKGTLRAHALSGIDNLVYSISCTTRAPRKGEREGADYYFISQKEFSERERQNMFLEHAFVHGNFYGTLREDVEREMEAGRDVLLEIDVQGAKQIRELLPESVLIFVFPPSLAVLEERLRRRKTESEEAIALRLENAKKEMEYSPICDHVVLNDTLDRASEALRDIVLGYRG